jgi:uncharacterized protein YbbC (DUF1343 family)
MSVQCGLDRLLDSLRHRRRPPELDPDIWRRLQGRVGLITHSAAVSRDLVGAAEALHGAGVRLTLLFGPEHGLRGDAPEGAHIASYTDSRTGVPVVSLYGDRQAPTRQELEQLDLLLIDFQDVGARYYTFQSTLTLAMEAATGVTRVAILDRPNPVGGAEVEGPRLLPRLASFVGRFPTPVRHGLTLGELARYAHRVHGRGDEPAVVRTSGWRRDQLWPALRPWSPPSPNIPTATTALLYLATGFIEGTPLSEGRGTALPFHQLGAPDMDAFAAAEAINAHGPAGVKAQPVWFRPSSGKHTGTPCGGVLLHVTDAARFRPVAAGVAVLAAMKRVAPAWEWRHSGDIPWVDRLFGTAAVREAIDAGQAPSAIAESWETDESAFREERRPSLLYEPRP